MKNLFLLICALALAAAGVAAPADRTAKRALEEVYAAIDAAESRALATQSVDELNAAAREQAVRELGLTQRQRKAFEPIYRSYREALDRAIDTEAAAANPSGEEGQRRLLKAKLANIAATAQVKRDYVDRFAAVLSAEQIRRLYNTEGQIGTSIKRAVADRGRAPKRLRGSGRMVTQDWGPAGDYKAISVESSFHVTVSPAARTITVTADDNVIDYLSVERSGGQLRFKFDPAGVSSTENISVSVIVPQSASLVSLSASSFGSVTCLAPVKGPRVAVRVSSSASVKADIDAGKMELAVSGFGKFEGAIRCEECDLDLSSSSSAKAEVECRGICRLTTSGFAKFGGSVAADTIIAKLSSSSSVGTPLQAVARLELTASGFASYKGDLKAGTALLDISSSASVAGPFEAQSFTATVSGFGKVALQGDAEVGSGTVTVSSSGAFAAPALRVRNYTVTASGFAKADVWCSGRLKVSATSGGQVSYDGPCTLDSETASIRRRK